MSHYIHEVPGRLRVKTPKLKNNHLQAQRAAEHMKTREGVLSTRANAVTGSLLIHYDVSRVNANQLLGTLREHGFLDPHPAPLAPPRGQAIDLGRKLSNTVVDKLVERVVERSAVALIAALI